jgi:hypothetical protein
MVHQRVSGKICAQTITLVAQTDLDVCMQILLSLCPALCMKEAGEVAKGQAHICDSESLAVYGNSQKRATTNGVTHKPPPEDNGNSTLVTQGNQSH